MLVPHFKLFQRHNLKDARKLSMIHFTYYTLPNCELYGMLTLGYNKLHSSPHLDCVDV